MTTRIFALVLLIACHKESAPSPPTDSAHSAEAESSTPPGGFVQIVAGDNHACALQRGGAVYCWGSHRWGQLGNAVASETAYVPIAGRLPTKLAIPFASRPQPIVLGSEAVALAASRDTTCAILVSRDVRCWGQRFDGTIGDAGVGAPLRGLHDVVSLEGNARFCAVDKQGKAFCWGEADAATQAEPTQLETKTPLTRVFSTPGCSIAVDSGGTTLFSGSSCPRAEGGAATPWRVSVDSVWASRASTCIAIGQERRCWGYDFGAPASQEWVTQGRWEGARGIAFTDAEICVIDRTGNVECGRHGVEMRAMTLPHRAMQIVFGERFMCVLDDASEIRCWGGSELGQAGQAGGIVPTPQSLKR